MIASVDLDEFDVAGAVGTELLSKPMIAEGVVFRARSHTGRFKLGKGESTGVVFMDADVDVSGVRGSEAKGGRDLFEDIDDGKEVLAGGAEGNVFSLHR